MTSLTAVPQRVESSMLVPAEEEYPGTHDGVLAHAGKGQYCVA